MLVSMPQFMSTAGICSGYFTCYGTIHIASSISWRLPFVLEASLAVVLAISCLYLPASPRWLLFHGQRDEALHASERLKLSRAEIEKDILATASRDQSHLSMWKGLTAVFLRHYRMRTALGLFILGMIQLCGIDGVLYVSRVGWWKPKIHRATNVGPLDSTHQYCVSKLVYRAEQRRSWHLAYLPSLC